MQRGLQGYGPGYDVSFLLAICVVSLSQNFHYRGGPVVDEGRHVVVRLLLRSKQWCALNSVMGLFAPVILYLRGHSYP